MFDLHIHSKNSHDGKDTLDALCLSAIEKGVKGLAITDHIDMHSYVERNAYQTIQQSIADTKAAREKYKDRLKVLCGVELGGYAYDPEMAKKVLDLTYYDVVIGSLHYVRKGMFDSAYSKQIYDEKLSDAQIISFIGQYFDELQEISEMADFDVLAHLTCPMRYINYVYKRGIDVMLFEDKITEILKKIIERGIALEVNTSCYTPKYGYSFDPDEKILRLYKSLGGELITLGSDAHKAGNIALGFDAALDMLKKVGFGYYCYFEQRKAQKVMLDS